MHFSRDSQWQAVSPPSPCGAWESVGVSPPMVSKMRREHYAFLTTEKNDVFVTAFLGLKAIYHALARGLSLASGLSPIWLSETRNAPNASEKAGNYC